MSPLLVQPSNHVQQDFLILATLAKNQVQKLNADEFDNERPIDGEIKSSDILCPLM